MGILLLILIVTVPRWAETLAQVDRLTLWGVPVTAIGEGIAFELIVFLLVTAYGRCSAAETEHAAKYERQQDEKEAGERKRITLLPENPKLTGYERLIAWVIVMETLTVLCQVPFIVHRLTGLPVDQLLAFWSVGDVQPLVWGYGLMLVVTPGVATIAAARAVQYMGAARVTKPGKTMKDRLEALIDWFTSIVDRVLDGGASVAPIASKTEPVEQRVSFTDRRNMILKVLSERPDTTKVDMARRFGVSATQIGKDIQMLERTGRIEGNGHKE